jgi:hypothetical protein
MDCQACVEEIPDDSLFCPECGARQDPSKSGSIGGRNFGVVSPQAVQAGRDMQAADAANAPAITGSADVLSQLATEMSGSPPVEGSTNNDEAYTQTDQMVDRIVENERAEKAGARNEWLTMNQHTASDVLANLAGGELPGHLASGSGGARLLDDGDDVSLAKKRVKANQPSSSLLRRMSEVAVRRVARKRGVAVESPQVAMTEDDTVRVNVTYIDDGRVLDTPPDLSNSFEHAIATELALKGFDIGIEIALFRSLDGEIELVWGDPGEDEGVPDEDEDLFACEDCGHYPISESDDACPGCGAAFVDDGDWESEAAPAPSPGGSPGPGGGGPSGPPRGPSRAAAAGPPGASSGPPSRGPSVSPARGPGGPPSRGPGGPPSRGPGGPPSKGPGGPPARGPGDGPPSKGPGGPPSKGPGGPPSKGPGGPPSKGPGGPPRKGPPR